MGKIKIRYEVRKTYEQELTEEEIKKIEQCKDNMGYIGLSCAIERCINDNIIVLAENPNDMTDKEQELLWYTLYNKSE